MNDESSKARPRVHVVGNFTWDTFDDKAKKILGGPPRFQAPLLAKLGFAPCLHSRITRKQRMTLTAIFPSDVLRVLNTDFLVLSEKATVFRHLYQESGERTSYLLSDAGCIPLSPKVYSHFMNDSTAKSAGIILSPVFHEIKPKDILTLSARSPVPLFFDPQGFLRELKPESTMIMGKYFWNLEILRSVDVIKVSSEEASFLHPSSDEKISNELNEWTAPAIHRMILEATAKVESTPRLHHSVPNLRLKMVILTRGSKGAELSMLVRDEQHDQFMLKHYLAPAFPTVVKNPTGAGDAFLVGFIHGWHVNKDVKIALAEANAVASVQISAETPLEGKTFMTEVKQKRARILDHIQVNEIPLE